VEVPIEVQLEEAAEEKLECVVAVELKLALSQRTLI
jgi:hypothetical protein